MQVLQSWCDTKADKFACISFTDFYTSFITILQQVIFLYHKGAKKKKYKPCYQKHIPDPTCQVIVNVPHYSSNRHTASHTPTLTKYMLKVKKKQHHYFNSTFFMYWPCVISNSPLPACLTYTLTSTSSHLFLQFSFSVEVRGVVQEFPQCLSYCYCNLHLWHFGSFSHCRTQRCLKCQVSGRFFGT